MGKIFAAVLAISMAVVWAGGCQEEQVSSGDQKARLEAVENRDLQSQLQAEKKKKNDEIKNLNAQSQAEIKKKDDEIKKLSEQLKKAQMPTHAEIAKRDGEIKKLTEQLKKAQASTQEEIAKRDDEIKKLSEREQLKKAQALTQAEITKRDDEIKELNAKLQVQMKKCDEDVRSVSKQLEQCENTRDERVAKEIDKQCAETVSNLMDWTVELSAEIEQLKAGQAGVKKEEEK
jgi:exonuclease SbcC